MLEVLRNFFLRLLGVPQKQRTPRTSLDEGVRILKHATAQRVVFFYPGEEGTFIEDATVTLFENGIVHIRAKTEETTTHLSHCEILWKFELNPEYLKNGAPGTNANLRVVKFPPTQPPSNPNPPTQ